jgi:hypothetical protein
MRFPLQESHCRFDPLPKTGRPKSPKKNVNNIASTDESACLPEASLVNNGSKGVMQVQIALSYQAATGNRDD